MLRSVYGYVFGYQLQLNIVNRELLQVFCLQHENPKQSKGNWYKWRFNGDPAVKILQALRFEPVTFRLGSLLINPRVDLWGPACLASFPGHWHDFLRVHTSSWDGGSQHDSRAWATGPTNIYRYCLLLGWCTPILSLSLSLFISTTKPSGCAKYTLWKHLLSHFNLRWVH